MTPYTGGVRRSWWFGRYHRRRWLTGSNGDGARRVPNVRSAGSIRRGRPRSLSDPSVLVRSFSGSAKCRPSIGSKPWLGSGSSSIRSSARSGGSRTGRTLLRSLSSGGRWESRKRVRGIAVPEWLHVPSPDCRGSGVGSLLSPGGPGARERFEVPATGGVPCTRATPTACVRRSFRSGAERPGVSSCR